MLGHKANLNKSRKTEIISSTFSGHSRIETRNQLQKKPNCKTHKHVAGTQYATKQAMETRYRPDPHLSAGNPQMGRTQRGNVNIPGNK